MKRLWKTARIVWHYDKTRRLITETAAEPGKTVATSYGYDKASNRINKLVATIGKDAQSPHRPTSAQKGILRGQVRGGSSHASWIISPAAS